MGFRQKTVEDMERILKQAMDQHEKVFGSRLTKKEANRVIDEAIETKRKAWLKGIFTDHSVEELETMKGALKNV